MDSTTASNVADALTISVIRGRIAVACGILLVLSGISLFRSADSPVFLHSPRPDSVKSIVAVKALAMLLAVSEPLVQSYPRMGFRRWCP